MDIQLTATVDGYSVAPIGSESTPFLTTCELWSMTYRFSLGSPTIKLISLSVIAHDRPKRSATIPKPMDSTKWEYNRSRSVTMSDKRLNHLANNEREALDAFVSRLCEQYAGHLERVVLFGSKARGDGDAESDLDVLIVLNDSD